MSTVKIEIWATTGCIDSDSAILSDVVEFDKEYWESLSEEEVREVLNSRRFSWWWNEVNDDSE